MFIGLLIAGPLSIGLGVGVFFHNNVIFRGTIMYLSFEGGFYGILSDGEIPYDPMNLPEELEEDGLRVFVIAKLRRDLGSFHLWGSIIEIRSIRVLDNN